MDFDICFFFISQWMPHYQKKNKNHNYHFGKRISTVLSSWDPAMPIIFPLKSLKEFIETGLKEKRVFPELYLKQTKLQHVDLSESI